MEESHHPSFSSQKPLISPSSKDDRNSYGSLTKNDDNDLELPSSSSFNDTTIMSKLKEWLYPPNVPRSVQLSRLENLATPACYLVVGLMQGLNRPLLNVYPLDLKFTEAQQVTIANLPSLPATLKLPFGFLSDNVPLFGYRRKSYMALGWLTVSWSMLVLMSFSNLDRVSKDGRVMMEGDGEDAPTPGILGGCFFMFGCGLWFADVMGDSIVAEKARLEPENIRGQLQSTCYACRFFGLMVAAPLSAFLYSSCGPRIVVILLCVIPLGMLPLIYVLDEMRNRPITPTRDQCAEIWKTVCSRSVWQPMAFVYFFNTLQVSNAAWKQFLRTVLNFTANQINSLLIAAYILLYVGIMTYKTFLLHSSWRWVYAMSILLNGFFSILQVFLVLGITFGLDPFWFALGDDAMAEFVGGVQFLPLSIMMVHLCPEGSEGASYAMFTSVWNAGLMLAPAISTMLLGIWDVSEKTMQLGDLSGMVKLTILTTFIQTFMVFFVWLLPRNREDLDALRLDKHLGYSQVGGFLVVGVVFVSVVYSLGVGILNVLDPGWAGES